MLYVVFFVFVCLIGYSFANQTNTSKEKYAWGFGRGKEHSQAVLDAKPFEALKKYDGIAMGNKDSNKIYLTFDSGYEAGYTEDILATLKKTNVKATFFITAHYLNTAENLVKKMIEEGHEVGNHAPKFLMAGVVA
ncbi:MAG: polysaccharide deacetylase family protein [Clostridia bacterium]|nr:polysaccharide deacetylase family protein [Clostridia bacterium]